MDMPQWKGLFDWSMQYQDGTRPTDWNNVDSSPEKLKWLEDIMKRYMVDFSQRMADMQESLQSTAKGTSDPREVEYATGLLEELQEIVESIDFARDLRKVGGLDTLQGLLVCPHPELRAGAAEVVATCAQNNPPVQMWMLEEGVLEACTGLLDDPDPAPATKALLAVSAITRGCALALNDFCTKLHGVPKVVKLVAHESPRTSRKALEYCKSLCIAVPDMRPALVGVPGFLGMVRRHLESGDDLMLSSSLGLLAELVDDQRSLGVIVEDAALKQVVESVQKSLNSREGEDREAVLEEIEAAQGIVQALST